jgi:hypothetical protein
LTVTTTPPVIELVIYIDPKKLRLTTADNPSGSSFVMSTDAISIQKNPDYTFPSDVAELTGDQLTLLTGTAHNIVTLSFRVQDAGQALGTYTYSIRGIIAKREVGNKTKAPHRFKNIRWTDPDNWYLNLQVDFDLDKSDLSYEYYLIIQNNESGAFGLIDPPMATKPTP